MRLRSTVVAHPVVIASIALILVGVTIFILAYFEPQKLLIDDRVNEPLPSLAGPTANAGSPAAATEARGKSSQPAIQTLSRGNFQSYEHSTSGQARVLRLADGSRFLRFEDFETSNGPDVRVYVSAAPAGGDGDAFDDDYIELGHLKGNIGDQNYAIPADLALGHFQSAVVWCKRFSVAFGAAPLQ